MVNTPVDATFAAEDPWIIPIMPLARMPTFAGPPGLWPAADILAEGPQSILVQRPEQNRPLVLSAIPLSSRHSRFAAPQPTAMLLLVDPGARSPDAAGLLHALYRLTPAETRLAQALLAGGGLRQAAETAGMTYETARWYLKILFHKTHTGRQAELVARLAADLAATPRKPGESPRLSRQPSSLSAPPPFGGFGNSSMILSCCARRRLFRAAGKMAPRD